VTGAVGIYAHDDSGESIADDALRVTEQRRRVRVLWMHSTAPIFRSIVRFAQFLGLWATASR